MKVTVVCLVDTQKAAKKYILSRLEVMFYKLFTQTQARIGASYKANTDSA